MHRIVVAFLALAFVAQTSQALADPLILTINGSAYGATFSDSIDVTNGFTGLNLALANPPLATLPSFTEPAVGASATLNSSFNLTASLSLDGATVTTLLSGPIQINVDRPSTATDLSGTAVGSAMAGSLNIPPGLDPATIPAWFNGLSAKVSGNVGGGSLNELETSLTISPGPSQVPEPSTFAILLIGVLAVVRKRVGCAGRI